MVFTYSNSPQEFEITDAYHDMLGLFPRAQGDLNTLWHINNIIADWNKAIRSFAAHWNTLDDSAKKNYVAAISSFIKMIDPVFVQGNLEVMDIPHLMWFVQYIAPEYGEAFQRIYMQKDLNNYLLDSVNGNIGLPTEQQRAEHADAVKQLLTKYAPDNWQQIVPEATVQKVLSQIFKKEVSAVQKASMEAKEAANMKIIGILIAGAFGVFLLSKITGKKVRA